MGLGFLISGQDLQVLGERKVLKEAEYAAVVEAGSLLDLARAQARQVVQQARDEAQDLRERARAEGLQSAREQAAREKIDRAAQAARELQAMREAMARIVVRAVEPLLAQADPATLHAAALQRVQAALADEPFLTVQAAPSEIDAVRAVLQRAAAQSNWVAAAVVEADASVAPGNCRVQTGSGTIELGVQAQLDALRRVLA